MLSLLVSLQYAKKPVILIPGTYASHLIGNFKDVDLEWYCPKNEHEKMIWLNEEYFIPPLYNCLFQWIQLHYDAAENKQVNHKGVTFHTQDFGGLSGINRVDRTFFNMSFIPYYTTIIERLQKIGYVEKVDLFGAPNDWRYGLAGLNDFFGQLKGLVEQAYEKNQQKVVLIGHSFGGFALQHFSSTYVTKEWAEKYIDNAILVAPSFGGSGVAVDIAWSHEIRQYFPFHLNHLTPLIESAGAVHIHFPNFELYGDTTIVIGPDGTKYTARDLPKLYFEHNKITGENINLFKLNQAFFEKLPDAPQAPTHLIYNSKQKTTLGFHVKKAWDKNEVDTLYTEGDGTVNSEGLDKYCQINSNSIDCLDIKESGKTGSHFSILHNEETLNYIFNLIEA